MANESDALAQDLVSNDDVTDTPIGSIRRRRKVQGVLDPMNSVNYDHRNVSWRDHAACRNHPQMQLDDFFEVSVTRKNLTKMEQIQKLCKGCPVAAECLYESLLFNYDGCWGGFTARQRYGYIRYRRDNSVSGLTLEECRLILYRMRNDPEFSLEAPTRTRSA